MPAVNFAFPAVLGLEILVCRQFPFSRSSYLVASLSNGPEVSSVLAIDDGPAGPIVKLCPVSLYSLRNQVLRMLCESRLTTQLQE